MFRYKYKISKCCEKIAVLKSRLSELGKMMLELNELLQLSTDAEKRSANLQDLREVKSLARDTVQEIDDLKKKLQYWRDEIDTPKSMMFDNL
jgi:hypothetical protein